MSRVIEHPFGRQSHSMSRAPGISQTRSRESIHCLIDRFRFGKAGGGVVEVDHGESRDSAGGKRGGSAKNYDI